MSECLIYQLKTGRTDVGRLDSDKPVTIKLSGESIAEEHCYFENNDGKVTLHAMPNAVTVCISICRVSRRVRMLTSTCLVPERSPNHSWAGRRPSTP